MGYPDSARKSFNEALGGDTFGTWWTEQNSQHVARTYNGESNPPFPSFASKKWRDEAGEALKKVIEHTESKYGDSIFAYVPGAGPCGEWFHFNTYANDANVNPADYSPVMETEFREYLKSIYNGNINSLNRSCNENYGSFEEIRLPTPEKRFRPSAGILRKPAMEKLVIDFYEYFNLLVADTLVEWAALSKSACRRQKLIMAFYGYQWVNTERHSLIRSGHVHLNKVLNSPDIDIIVAPYMYDVREVGGVISSQTLAASVKNSGKMCLYEMEPATSIKADWPYGNHLPKTHEESREIMKRDITCVLLNGAACWYMDLMGGMFDHPELIKGLYSARVTGEKHSLDSGTSCAQIAVILHDKAGFYFKEADPFLNPLVNMFKVWELERIGAPFDDILLSDLPDIDMSRYKFFIFPNAIYLSDSERSLINEKCLKNGSVVLWCYASGVLDDSGLSSERMKELTGIHPGFTMEPGEVVVELTAQNSEYTKGLNKGITYGTNGGYLPIDAIKEQACLNCYPGPEQGFSVAPRFWVDDKNAEVLGMLSGIEKPGLAVKNMGGWISAFSSAPMVPKEIIRNLAEKAGCHIFTDFPGQTFGSKNFFGFYSHKTGNCTIKLPYKSRIRELFSDKIIAESADEISMDIKENTTILLHYTEV
jgi:hypothetical protein